MRAGLVQLTVGDLPVENVAPVRAAVRAAIAGGAGFVLTPECTNGISADRQHQHRVLTEEAADPVLSMLRNEAARAGVWVLAGSVIVKTGDATDDRFANRSVLIGPDGAVAARYDKIHLFDVDLSAGERYRESDTIAAGARAVVAPTPWGALGLSICYDLRFPKLYRHLAHQGADFLSIPAAFTRTTGQAHWHILIRARAIENGCFVFAPAQTGTHAKGRQTYGHALIVDPWGEVLADAGEEVGFIVADIDPAKVADARARIPALMHERPFT